MTGKSMRSNHFLLCLVHACIRTAYALGKADGTIEEKLIVMLVRDGSRFGIYGNPKAMSKFKDSIKDASGMLENGRKLHNDNCAGCHTKPKSAFISNSFALATDIENSYKSIRDKPAFDPGGRRNHPGIRPPRQQTDFYAAGQENALSRHLGAGLSPPVGQNCLGERR